MESNILPERIANAILMDTTFTGYYLIVEGPKDYKVFSKFLDLKNIRIMEAFGCEKVKKTIQILSARKFANKLGIIDADFRRIMNMPNECESLFLTDFHDIEIMIIKTVALENILNTFCSRNKIEDFEKKAAKSIREILYDLAKNIALLKLTNKIYQLGLLFKPRELDGNHIKYRDFIDDKNLNFKGVETMIESLINYSRSKSPNIKSKQIIIEKLQEVSTANYDIEQLINGHDLAQILYLLIKKVFASSNRMLTDHNSIEDSLTLAYEYADFKKTNLFAQLKEFEDGIPLTILRQ